MLRIAICDDINLTCTEIKKEIMKYGRAKSIDIKIEVFTKGERLLEFIENEHEFDLIFLDINLGTTTGIQVGTTIREDLNNIMSKIVFFSYTTERAMELFELNPLNFLKKPISSEDIAKCIERTLVLEKAENWFFEIKSERKKIKISMNSILYFENSLRKIKIVTTEGEFYFYDKILSIIEKLPGFFIVVHNSYVVNYNKIKMIHPSKIVMNNDVEISISKKYKRKIDDYQMNKIKGESNGNL